MKSDLLVRWFIEPTCPPSLFFFFFLQLISHQLWRNLQVPGWRNHSCWRRRAPLGRRRRDGTAPGTSCWRCRPPKSTDKPETTTRAAPSTESWRPTARQWAERDDGGRHGALLSDVVAGAIDFSDDVEFSLMTAALMTWKTDTVIDLHAMTVGGLLDTPSLSGKLPEVSGFL